MVANFNTDLTSIMNQLGKLTSNGSGKGSVNIAQSYSDIAWFSNAVGTLGAGNVSPEQKSQTIQGLVKKALSLISSAIGEEAQKAKAEVNKQTQKAEALKAKSEKLGVKLEGSFKEISSSIDKQTEIIKDANKQIENVKKSIEEKQKQIENLVQQIEQKQTQLRAAKSTEEKTSILSEIQGLSSQIGEICTTLKDDKATYDALEAAVNDSQKNIEEATNKMQVIEQDGKGEITQMTQEAVQGVNDTVNTATTGQTNKVTGDAAEKAAQQASSNVVTGSSVAPKLYKVANDQHQAANTRLQSIAQNFGKLSQGIGTLGNSAQILESFKTSIGSSTEKYAGYLGEWGTAIASPAITSLGSYSNVLTGTEELNKTVKEDLSTLGASSDVKNCKDGNVKNTTAPDTKNKDTDPNVKNPINNTQQTTLKTPEFQVKKLSFGL